MIIKKIYLPLVLILFFFLSFILRFISLNQTGYANGWDGYYYLIQVKGIIEEGAMHSADASLIYPVLLLVTKISGNYILSYKILPAILCGFLTLSFFLLANEILDLSFNHRDKSKNFTTALLISAFSTFSPGITFLASQFPKNLLGFLFFNFFILSLLKLYNYISKNKNYRKDISLIKKIIPIAVSFLLCFFSHRMAAGLSLLVLAIISLIYIIKHKYYRLILAGIVSLIFLVIISINFPGVIHVYDLKRFEGLFSFIPQAAPISFINLVGKNKFSILWKTELLLLYSLLIFYIYYILKFLIFKKIQKHFLINNIFKSITALSFFMVFPFYNFNLMGMAYRFFFLFIIITPFLFIPIVEKFPAKLQKLLITCILILSFFSKNSYIPGKFDPPYSLYESLTNKILLKLQNQEYDLVVIHKAFAEFFTFQAGIDALPWQPETSYSYKKVWRVFSGITQFDLKYYLQDKMEKQVISLSKGYYLIREDHWQNFIKSVKLNNDRQLLEKIYSWKNPYKIRPAYLTRGKNINEKEY